MIGIRAAREGSILEGLIATRWVGTGGTTPPRTGIGPPLAVGLVALALTLALVGYCAVQLGWRAYVMLAWRARRRRRGKQ